MNTPIIPQGYHPPSSPGRFSSLQNDDEQSEDNDEPESQHKISLRHNKRSHVGYDHFFDVPNPKITIWTLGNLALHSEETHTFICSHPSLLDRIAQFLVVDNYAFSAAAFFFFAIARREVPDPQIINSLYLNSVESIVQLANGDIFRSTPPLTQTHAHPLEDLFKALRHIDISYSALVNLTESNFFFLCSYFLCDPLYLNCSSSILHFIVSLTVYDDKDPRIPIILHTLKSTPLFATILQFVKTTIDKNQIVLFDLSLRRCFTILTNLIFDSEDLSKEILDSNILTTILSVVELFPPDTLTELVFLLLNLSNSTHEIAQSAIKFNIPRFALVFLRGLTNLSTVSKSISMLTKFLMKDRTGLFLQQIQDLDLIPYVENHKESQHLHCQSSATKFLLEYQQREQAFQFQAQRLESSSRGEIIPDVAVTPPFDDEDYSDSENDDDLEQGPYSPNVMKGAFL
ncbi:hypothetical protein BLNAU_19456 [Blattamonas nauphoetae]|uniref:Uncharacterized protein n=1 Tax=Blattamonas nauphoetae TaxID=2049346 RepID=A0ABQ9X1D1_9EUKA|nr:hypothetical protein BLNAU_19456 [Blattamonas nauphoetae]